MQRTASRENKKDTPDLEVIHKRDRYIISPFDISIFLSRPVMRINENHQLTLEKLRYYPHRN